MENKEKLSTSKSISNKSIQKRALPKLPEIPEIPSDEAIEKLKKQTITAMPLASTSASESGFISKLGTNTNQVLKTSPALKLAVVSFAGFDNLEEKIKKTWRSLPLLQRLRWQKDVLSEYSERFESLIIGPRSTEKMLMELTCDLVNRDYLLTEENFTQQIKKHYKKMDDKISSIGIVSGNRTESMLRAVESYGRHCKEHGRATPVLICNDSKEEKTRIQYKEGLKELKKKHNFPIRHIGLEDKKEFAKKLSEKGIDPKSIQFALLPSNNPLSSYGKNRNALSLANVGEMFISADDDTFCKPHKAKDYKPGVEFVSTNSKLLDMDAFSSRKDALESQSHLNECILDLHERVLGKNLSTTVLDNIGSPLCSFDPKYTYIKKSLLKGHGHVNLSFNGLVGDSGSGENTSHLFVKKNMAKEVFQSQEYFNQRKVQRDVYKASNMLRITRRNGCMTTFFGVDARKGISPFFPFYRMEDAIFANLMYLTDPKGHQAHLPWELEHLPLEIRKRTPLSPKSNVCFVTMHEMINSALSIASVNENSPNIFTDNHKRLSQAILDFCGQSVEDFNDIMTMNIIQQKTSEMLRLEGLLKQNKSYPKYWKEEVKNTIKSIQNQIQGHIFLGDPELVKSVPYDQVENISRKQLIEFANLLNIWPDIIEASLELKKEGYIFGTDL